jgi:hypothetical protein
VGQLVQLHLHLLQLFKQVLQFGLVEAHLDLRQVLVMAALVAPLEVKVKLKHRCPDVFLKDQVLLHFLMI